MATFTMISLSLIHPPVLPIDNAPNGDSELLPLLLPASTSPPSNPPSKRIGAFFVPYLAGSISLVVLAVGSTAPGLLQADISSFASFFPDYRERIASHEAAYFLDIGKEHVNLIDQRLEKLIYRGQLDAKELDRLAVVAMAGLTAEGLKYDKVIGQSADLFTLQRFINRSKPQISKDQQQNLTRWAVVFAGSHKNDKAMHDALIAAMSNKATILECIEAIEKAGWYYYSNF